jgi:hypothetical protein
MSAERRALVAIGVRVRLGDPERIRRRELRDVSVGLVDVFLLRPCERGGRAVSIAHTLHAQWS